ncbi:hypothetical protein BDY19DRAFT_988447 [Irpex rosettiformis]|uniref:Uncharacterized protein n=1 Tax=Irpex rosettiformis TaxID=378272 RepID=A0ACB8UK68_9APHY|nr:hypothetical protein BDY19DRAFT_988447 [Irpex rosettiformis]
MSPASVMAARAETTTSPAAAITPLTGDVAIQYILADIPFYTVGVFALGAFTFCLVMRKFNWLMFCLFASVWMAFAAAILDLVESLAISRGNDLSNSTNLALTIAREVAYALSFGMRNLWFWLYVASPPPAAPVSQGSYVHSGSWHRWGLFGHLLKWVVLLSVIAIVCLQVLFRVDTPLMMDGPVYDADGTLQVILSFVFMLKLFMNTYLVALDSVKETWWRSTLLRYLPIFMALMINFGVALGNILQFIFSETVLGRFLQAIEFYILILSTLISTFYHLRNIRATPAVKQRRNRSSSFNNIPAGASISPELVIPPPRLPSTDLTLAFQRQLAPDHSRRPSVNRQSSSYALRLSNWIGRRPSQRNERDRDDLFWMQNQAEKGNSPVDIDVKIPTTLAYDLSPLESEPSPSYKVPPQAYANASVDVPTIPKSILAISEQKPPGPIVVSTRARIRFSDGGGQTLDLAPPPTGQYAQTRMESPIFGLNGIVNAQNVADAVERPPSTAEDDPRTFFDNTPRSSGISNLLRQQEELDKSIAALKLFSNDPSEAASARRSLSGFSDTRRASSSVRSIESLSNFPIPPWGRASMASLKTRNTSTETVRQSPPGLPPASMQSSSETSLGTIDNLLAAAATEPMPLLNVPGHRVSPSVPSSEIGDDLLGSAASGRINTGGMEITSFIGNLSHPGHKAAGSTGTLTKEINTGSQGRLEAIKESPRTPQTGPYFADTSRPLLAVDTSLSPFPVSPTGWTVSESPEGGTSAAPISVSPSVSAVLDIATRDAAAARSQRLSQRRPIGLPSGPKLSVSPR